MKTRVPIPKPLFDTLENLSALPWPCISEYLTSLNIEEATKEYTLTKEFLLSYSGSPDTFTAYRREVERLLHWSWLIAKKPIKLLSRNDIRDFLTFAISPLTQWISEKNQPRFFDGPEGRMVNTHWRPFVARINKAQRANGKLPDRNQYKLGNKSIEALFAGLSTYFTFLQQEEYLENNPITLVRQKNRFLQRTQSLKITRKLSGIQWSQVIDVVEGLARNAPEEHERTLFILSAFYLLGLRISELAETPGRYPKMSDFAPDKRGLWWFTTVSKGNKVRDVAVPDAMMSALKRYRQSLGLSMLPSRSEDSPLLHKQRGMGGLGTRQVRKIVQLCFDKAEQVLRDEGKVDEAEDLRVATVHWLRHTAISADVEFRPREHVRDDVGHENPATTERYIDADRLARHQSAKHKPLKPEMTSLEE